MRRCFEQDNETPDFHALQLFINNECIDSANSKIYRFSIDTVYTFEFKIFQILLYLPFCIVRATSYNHVFILFSVIYFIILNH